MQDVAGRLHSAQIVIVVDESRTSAQEDAGLAELDIAFEFECAGGIVDDGFTVVGDHARAFLHGDFTADAYGVGTGLGESFGRGKPGLA